MWIVLKMAELTCCIKMATAIIRDHHIRLLHSSIMPDPVLLQGLGVKYSYPSTPHAWHSKQDCFVTPKISSEQQMQVLLKRQRRSPPSDLPCLNFHSIIWHQRQIFIFDHQLAVVYHETDHHSPEVPIRKIGGLLWSGSAHWQQLFQWGEEAVSSPINLQNNNIHCGLSAWSYNLLTLMLYGHQHDPLWLFTRYQVQLLYMNYSGSSVTCE